MLDERRKDDLTPAQFTVDAALLRELGEQLIGRAHIALAELVKNSYDADAHTCRIDLADDRIVVSDDGHGMSQEEFLQYRMRIGTAHKVDWRQSRDLRRPMTGSKGLGRLSVQFLADEMELKSSCADVKRLRRFSTVLKRRFVVRNGGVWYRTIDRVRAQDWVRPKLLVPEIAKVPRVAIDRSGAIPSHGVYAVFAPDDDVDTLYSRLRDGTLANALQGISPGSRAVTSAVTSGSS